MTPHSTLSLAGVGGGGEHDGEAGTGPEFARDLDPAAVEIDPLFRQGEAEASALIAPGEPAVELHEGLRGRLKSP